MHQIGEYEHNKLLQKLEAEKQKARDQEDQKVFYIILMLNRSKNVKRT
jgi:hypothetical protein